ncbi:hypothetical protein R3P38DRAFT_3592218 [Favolaschia claudopus]|uniref:Reverse transcriptase zinc-binding domain-containing protein n=1 Tax=Favolaschia claudopus TaxID=2862362 RepID=A0AAW0AGT2_9AGAR
MRKRLPHASFDNASTITLEVEPDLMFSPPGILLNQGTQRRFTKIIASLRTPSERKTTFTNLERTRCCLTETFEFSPSNEAIWKSLTSTNINRLTRNFLWKCMHETYRLGAFWDHVPHLEHFGLCIECKTPESMEHIMLECDARGQKLIWNLAERLWRLRYTDWPTLSWGLLLGCSLARFKIHGKIQRGKNRFFTIIVSTSIKLIWSLRNERVFEGKTQPSTTEIHNRWLALINGALKRDQLLTNKFRFGNLAKNTSLVLETWSGALSAEDALPDDWTRVKGVLVGIWPASRRNGVG